MDVYLLIGSFLMIVAILSTRLAQRFGVPALVLFVAIGMLAGSSGPYGLAFADYRLSLDLGLMALAVILLSGGWDTRTRHFRVSLVPASLLATVGVVVKMLVVGTVAFLVTPLTFAESLLLGAVLAPTDAAAVFSVLKGRGLPARLRGVLETESGTNDPMSIYLTLTLTAFITTGQASVPTREQLLLSWAGLKGAVPIILAIVPLLNQVPSGEFIFNIVFVVVIIGTALQGLTVAPLAMWLGLSKLEPAKPALRLKLAGVTPPGSAGLTTVLDPGAEAVGQRLAEISLPPDIVIAAIYRKGEVIAPRGDTKLLTGDHVFILNGKADTASVPPVLSGRHVQAVQPPTEAPPTSATAHEGQ